MNASTCTGTLVSPINGHVSISGPHISPVPVVSTPTGTGDTSHPNKRGSGLVDHAGPKPRAEVSGAPGASAHP